MVIFQILFFLNINQEASVEDNYLTIFIRAFVAIFSRLNYKDAQVNKDSIFDKFKFPINKKPRIQSVIWIRDYSHKGSKSQSSTKKNLSGTLCFGVLVAI